MNAMTNLNLVSKEFDQAAQDEETLQRSSVTAATPRARLRYKKPHAYLRSYQLPFIGKGDELDWDFWKVPLIGSFTANDAGIYFAQMLLLYFRRNELEYADNSLLSSIILAMLRKARSATDEELDSLECQVHGFMQQLSVCVAGAAQSDSMRDLDKIDPKILLREANFALNGKPYRDSRSVDKALGD